MSGARRRVTIAERRARLARRHLLAPSTHTDDVAAIADAVVALHSSDPVTVYLSATARMAHPSIAAVSDALYEQHAVVRHHAMRRTLWVMSPEVAREAHAACTVGLVRPEWNRTVKLHRIERDHRRRRRVAARRRARHPRRTPPARLGEHPADRPGGARADQTAAHGGRQVVRGVAGRAHAGPAAPRLRRRHHPWTAGRHLDQRPVRVVADRCGRTRRAPRRSTRRRRGRRLVRRVLRAFGPMTTLRRSLVARRDRRQRRRRAACRRGGGGRHRRRRRPQTGWLLPDDLDVGSLAPLTGRRCSPGSTRRRWGGTRATWYLGEHGALVFDRNGNGGPTLWVDGEIVGSWVQRKDGRIVHQLLQDVPTPARHSLERQLGELRGPVRRRAPHRALPRPHPTHPARLSAGRGRARLPTPGPESQTASRVGRVRTPPQRLGRPPPTPTIDHHPSPASHRESRTCELARRDSTGRRGLGRPGRLGAARSVGFGEVAVFVDLLEEVAVDDDVGLDEAQRLIRVVLQQLGLLRAERSASDSSVTSASANGRPTGRSGASSKAPTSSLVTASLPSISSSTALGDVLLIAHDHRPTRSGGSATRRRRSRRVAARRLRVMSGRGTLRHVGSRNAPWSRAAASVFSSRQATVIGPVPPGIGVIAPATACTSSNAHVAGDARRRARDADVDHCRAGLDVRRR